MLTRDSVYFHLDVPVKGILPIVGGDPVFVRDTGALLVGQQNILHTWIRSQPRIEVVDVPVTGIDPFPAILLEESRTNKVPYSRDLSTWVQGGTCSFTIGQRDSRSELGASLVTASTAAAYRYAIIAAGLFTGNTAKAPAIILKKHPSTSFTQVGLYSTTTGTWLHLLNITWDANGVPTITTQAGGGTYYLIPLSDGYWLIEFTTNAATAAQSHALFLYPGGPGTGSVYFDAAFVDDGPFSTSPAPDSSGNHVPRSVERLYFRSAPPAGVDLLMYGAFRYGGDMDAVPYRLMVGKGDGTGAYTALRHSNTGELQFELHNGVTALGLPLAVPGGCNRGDLVEWAAYVNSSQESVLTIQRNRDILDFVVSSAMPTLPTAWGGASDARIYLNSTGGALDGSCHYSRVLMVNPLDMTFDPLTQIPEAFQELQRFRQSADGRVVR